MPRWAVLLPSRLASAFASCYRHCKVAAGVSVGSGRVHTMNPPELCCSHEALSGLLSPKKLCGHSDAFTCCHCFFFIAVAPSRLVVVSGMPAVVGVAEAAP